MAGSTALRAPASSRPVVRRLGRVSYREAHALQRRLVSERAEGIVPDTLLLLVHPAVVTMGRGGRSEHLVASAETLTARGIEFVETDRGGDVTFHGPGQIVGYPIVDLSQRGRDLHRYLRDLEALLIRALAEFGIEADRAPGWTGVWIGDAKVAAIGIRVSRWVAHHGFALNVSTDLSCFDLIVPCGIRGKRVTSMREILRRPIDLEQVEDALERAFVESFGPEDER